MGSARSRTKLMLTGEGLDPWAIIEPKVTRLQLLNLGLEPRDLAVAQSD
jgi:hypothetical protein